MLWEGLGLDRSKGYNATYFQEAQEMLAARI
jgi:hypothetical protein